MKGKKLIVSILALILVGAMVLGIVISLLPQQASAVTSGELKEQLDALQAEKDAISEQLRDLEAQQSENREDIKGIMEQKAVIEQQIALLYEEISNVNEQISAYSLLIADKQTELEEAQARLDELTVENRERLRAMEEEGELSYWSVIFKANSFSDLLDRVSMVKEIAAADQRRLDEMNQVAQQVLEKQQELETEKAQLEKTREELKQSQTLLDAKNAETDQLLADLVAVCEDMEQLEREFEAEEDAFLTQIALTDQLYQDKLAEEAEISRQASIQASIQASVEASIQASIQASIEASIDASIKESVAAAEEESRRQEEATRQTETTKQTEAANEDEDDKNEETTEGNTITSSPSKPSSSGGWIKPVAYTYISSPFGYRWHPVTGEWSMHKGVDMPMPTGTPIYASRSGYVTIATYHSTAGNYVTINHQDGYSSVYMHMTHDVVSVGEYVKAGQLIGYVGSTGRSTGPHLHFGITYNGTYVNPMDYL